MNPYRVCLFPVVGSLAYWFLAFERARTLGYASSIVVKDGGESCGG